MTERLGRYTVLKHLASGGMADVLLARGDGVQGFERHVVLKRIRSEHAKDERFIEMFLDEARLAAQLHHQNIVQVHDIGEANGDYFFAMEYLHGEDLRSLLSKTAKAKQHMPLGHVVSIISAVAAGLHHAHERKGADKKPLNVVHRDVSPSNVIIGYDGSVKIVDFGIAKAAMRQVETRSGSLKGKVSYMSPEQCKMTPIDRRSDIYALGVVLYEMATTTRLFKGDSDYLVMDAICTGKIPLPRVRRSDLPNELAMIIMTALATDPARRYQTADELRSALDAFAIKAGIASNAGALATYMRKLFGEKAEPWLELARKKDPTQPPQFADTLALESGRSWSDMAAMGSNSFDDEAAVDPQAKTKSDRKSAAFAEAKTASGTGSKRRMASQPGQSSPAAELAAAAIEPGQPGSTGRVQDRTSTRMAWESEGEVPATRARPPAKKLALYALPVVALAGLGVWKMSSGGSSCEAAPSSAPVATSAAPAAAPSVTPLPADPRPAVAPPAPAPAAAAVAPPAPMAEPVREATVDKTAAAATKDTRSEAKAEIKKAERPAPTAKAAPAPVATKPPEVVAKAEPPKAAPPAPPPVAVAVAVPAKTEAPKPVTPAAPTPAPPAATPPPPPAPAVAAPAAPVVVETPPMAKLSQGSIAAVASQHSRELSKCEGTADLHGEITVRFEVNAAGRVTKSQVSSTLKNPKVTGCILVALKTWQFPKPSTGGPAEGTYTMSYQ